MTHPTDALRMVPVEPTEAMLDAVKPWPEHWPPYGQATVTARAAYDVDRAVLRSNWTHMLAAAPASPLPRGALPADVVRLVIAARMVAFDRVSAATIAELDAASEAFASRVPWDNAPDEFPAAPTGEPK